MSSSTERKRVAILCEDRDRLAHLARMLDGLGYATSTASEESFPDAVLIVAALQQSGRTDGLAALLELMAVPALVAWGAPADQTLPACGWFPDDASADAVQSVMKSAVELATARRQLEELAHQLADARCAAQQAQSECERLSGLASLGQAAVQLNHDINNPLCSISLNAQLLLLNLDGRLEDKLLDKLRSIETNADRIRDLTANLTNAKRRALSCEESADERSEPEVHA
jgi:C4-dicarboxylate-specific signal transduction histidine kinase